MAIYLDKLGRRIEVQITCSGKYMALVKMKNRPSWKSFFPRKIRPNISRAEVEEALGKFALKYHLTRLN